MLCHKLKVLTSSRGSPGCSIQGNIHGGVLAAFFLSVLWTKVQDVRFMRRTSRQGLAKRATAEPAVLKRDPRYGQRPPSLREWLSRGGVQTSACCVFCCLLCVVLFCFGLSFLVLVGLFCEKQLLNQVKLGVAVLLCCALPSLFLDVIDLLLICLPVCLVS